MDVEKLVLKGFFPEEITPAFVTDDLQKALSKIIENIDTYDPVEKSNGKKKKICKLLAYSCPKTKAYRRNIVVPNPLAMIRLSKTIADNWKEITDFTGKSTISLSPLKESSTSGRAIMQPSFDTITDQKILRSTGHRYALKVDILRFYGNIYTHSIPWALHSKEVSKSKKNKRSELLGNAIDEDVRKMQDGQTMGIPIGPDTSRIVSEIIASYIDIELQKQLKNLRGIRVVDDYTLFFKNQGELETARSIILKLLRDLELDLNQGKENIVELPEQVESEWYNHLRDFKFSNNSDFQHKDIIAYFDLSFFYSRKYPWESILPYSIQKISATVFKPDNWPILESFLLQSLLVEPKVLPHVTRIFISHEKREYKLNHTLIKIVLDDFLSFHLSLDNHFEVSWGLWFCKHLKIEISENVANQISENDNSIIILTALDVFKCNLIPTGLNTKEWEKLLTTENLYSKHWLLVYEGLKKGWLSSSTDIIEKDPFFKLLKDYNVEFYKPENFIDISNVKVTSNTSSLLMLMDVKNTNETNNTYNHTENNDVLDDLPF